jgi:serine/threonine-protein kinase
MIGKTVGKYKIVDRLGRGGMGTVFKAVDETLDREVAVKVLNANALEEEAVKRFRAEAIMLAKLNHPRIATVYELARADDDLLMVMELVGGDTFERLVSKEGPLPVERAVWLCSQVLEALEHAHGAGIVHRDLKPANLMVTKSGDVKVMDFGIARVLGTEHLTTDGYLMGTPAYMAPEQVRAEEIDRRADLYAVGVVLYRLLTGRLPFKADTAVAMIQSQLADAPLPVREARPDLPEWIQPVLSRALAKSASERFQSAEEFRLALEPGLMASRTMRRRATIETADLAETIAAPLTPTALRVTPGATPPATPAPAEAVAAPTGGHREPTVTLRKPQLAMAGALVAALVVAVAILGYIVVKRRPVAAAESAPAAVATEPPSAPVEATPAPGPPAADVPTPLVADDSQTPPSPPVPAARGAASTASVVPAKREPARVVNGAPAPLPATKIVDPAKAPEPVKPPEPTAPVVDDTPLSFAEVKALVPDGDKAKEADAWLDLGAGAVSVKRLGDRSVIKTFPYASILSATYIESKNPRWSEGDGFAPVPPAYGNRGSSFLTRAKHWLALQSKDDFVIVRFDKENVPDILKALEARRIKVQRPAPADKN